MAGEVIIDDQLTEDSGDDEIYLAISVDKSHKLDLNNLKNPKVPGATILGKRLTSLVAFVFDQDTPSVKVKLVESDEVGDLLVESKDGKQAVFVKKGNTVEIKVNEAMEDLHNPSVPEGKEAYGIDAPAGPKSVTVNGVTYPVPKGMRDPRLRVKFDII